MTEPGRCGPSEKVIHATERDARRALAESLRRAMISARPTNLRHWRDPSGPVSDSGIYECEHCRGWHLTARPRSGELIARLKKEGTG
jgi:hypothetical protein